MNLDSPETYLPHYCSRLAAIEAVLSKYGIAPRPLWGTSIDHDDNTYWVTVGSPGKYDSLITDSPDAVAELINQKNLIQVKNVMRFNIGAQRFNLPYGKHKSSVRYQLLWELGELQQLIPCRPEEILTVGYPSRTA